MWHSQRTTHEHPPIPAPLTKSNHDFTISLDNPAQVASGYPPPPMEGKFPATYDNMWTMNSQMFKLVLEKAEEPEIKLPTSAGSLKKQERSRKTSISSLLTMPKPLTVWITINCGKVFKRWAYQTTLPASWETYMQVRKQQLELDMEQQTGSK